MSLYEHKEVFDFEHNIQRSIIEIERRNHEADTIMNTFWDIFQEWVKIYANRFHCDLFAYKSEIDETQIEFGWSLNGCILCICEINTRNISMDCVWNYLQIKLDDNTTSANPKSSSDMRLFFERLSTHIRFQKIVSRFLKIALERENQMQYHESDNTQF